MARAGRLCVVHFTQRDCTRRDLVFLLLHVQDMILCVSTIVANWKFKAHAQAANVQWLRVWKEHKLAKMQDADREDAGRKLQEMPVLLISRMLKNGRSCACRCRHFPKRRVLAELGKWHAPDRNSEPHGVDWSHLVVLRAHSLEVSQKVDGTRVLTLEKSITSEVKQLNTRVNALHKEVSIVVAEEADDAKVVVVEGDATHTIKEKKNDELRTSTLCLQHCHVVFLEGPHRQKIAQFLPFRRSSEPHPPTLVGFGRRGGGGRREGGVLATQAGAELIRFAPFSHPRHTVRCASWPVPCCDAHERLGSDSKVDMLK